MNWARVVTVTGNIIFLILIGGIVIFQGLDGLFSSDSYLSSIGFNTEIMSEHKILTGIYVFGLIVTTYKLGFASEVLNWFKDIKSQTELKVRTQRFLKGFSAYILVTFGLGLALEIKTLNYIDRYGSEALSAFQMPIPHNVEDAVVMGVALTLAILTLIWLYYLIVFIFFPLIFNRKNR